MSSIWTDTEAEIVFVMVEEKNTYKDISEYLREEGFNRSANAVRKFYKRCTVATEEDKSAQEPELVRNIELSSC